MKRDTSIARNEMRSTINERSLSFLVNVFVRWEAAGVCTSGIIKDLSPESPTRLVGRRGDDDGARFESRQDSSQRKEEEPAAAQKGRSYA